MGRFAIILIITLIILLSFFVIHVNNRKIQTTNETIDDLSYKQAKNIANSAAQMISRKILLPNMTTWPDFTEAHLGSSSLHDYIPAEYTDPENPAVWERLDGFYYVDKLERINGSDLLLVVAGIEEYRNIVQLTRVLLKENETMLNYWDYAVYSKTTLMMNNPNPYIDSFNSNHPDSLWSYEGEYRNAPVGTDLPYTSPTYPINRPDQIHGPDPDYAAGKYLPPITMPPGGTPIDPSGNSDFTISDGIYRVDGDVSRGGNGTLLVTGDVTLHIYGSLSVAGSSTIAIGNADNPNSSLKIYIDGNIDIGGTGFVNYSEIPANLQIFGTENCTSIRIRGTADTYAAIYAPNADIDIGGNPHFFGAVVGNSVEFIGNGSFHYDEALGGPGGPSYSSIFKYYIASWE